MTNHTCQICGSENLPPRATKYCSPACAAEGKREYKLRTRDRARELWVVWYANNREHHRAKERAYAAANLDLYREKMARRNARKAANGRFRVTERDRLRAIRRFDSRCAYCHEPFTKENPLNWDHVLPVTKGGRDSIGNILPACRRCNQRKQGSLLMAWRIRDKISI